MLSFYNIFIIAKSKLTQVTTFVVVIYKLVYSKQTVVVNKKSRITNYCFSDFFMNTKVELLKKSFYLWLLLKLKFCKSKNCRLQI